MKTKIYDKEKFEVGEYVKTKNGEIAKIIEIAKSVTNKIIYCTDKDITINKVTINCLSNDDLADIVKHSKNIIDLIEVGDYVNGYEVLDKYLFNGEKPVLETDGEETNCKCLCNSDIKSIVTKEQFESVEYKI